MIINVVHLSINEFRLSIYNMKRYPFNFIFNFLSSLVYLGPLVIGIKRVDGIEQLISLSFMPLIMSLGVSDKINELREKGVIEQLITGRYSFTEYILAVFVNNSISSLAYCMCILYFTNVTFNVSLKIINIVFLIMICITIQLSLEFLFSGLLLRFKKLGMLFGIVKFIITIMFLMPFSLLSEKAINLLVLFMPISGVVAYAQSFSGRFVFSNNGVCFMLINIGIVFIVSIISYKKLYNKTRKLSGLSHY